MSASFTECLKAVRKTLRSRKALSFMKNHCGPELAKVKEIVAQGTSDAIRFENGDVYYVTFHIQGYINGEKI